MKPKFVLAVYTRKSKKKRIFETNDTIYSLLENDGDWKHPEICGKYCIWTNAA